MFQNPSGALEFVSRRCATRWPRECGVDGPTAPGPEVGIPPTPPPGRKRTEPWGARKRATGVGGRGDARTRVGTPRC